MDEAAPQPEAVAEGAEAVAQPTLFDQVEELIRVEAPHLITALRTGHSTNYNLGAVINGLDGNLDLKRAVARLLINDKLAKGDAVGAIGWLAYVNAAELDMPEFGAEFLQEILHASGESQDTVQPHRIALARHYYFEKIFPKSAPDKPRMQSSWAMTEHLLFMNMADQLIEESDPDPRLLRFAFNTLRFRSVGYKSEQNPNAEPGIIAEKLAEKYVKYLLGIREIASARTNAGISGLITPAQVNGWNQEINPPTPASTPDQAAPNETPETTLNRMSSAFQRFLNHFRKDTPSE